jgi:hypothetical protein
VKVLCFVKTGCKSKVIKSESDFLQFLNHESILLAQRALDILL